MFLVFEYTALGCDQTLCADAPTIAHLSGALARVKAA